LLQNRAYNNHNKKNPFLFLGPTPDTPPQVSNTPIEKPEEQTTEGSHEEDEIPVQSKKLTVEEEKALEEEESKMEKQMEKMEVGPVIFTLFFLLTFSFMYFFTNFLPFYPFSHH